MLTRKGARLLLSRLFVAALALLGLSALLRLDLIAAHLDAITHFADPIGILALLLFILVAVALVAT